MRINFVLPGFSKVPIGGYKVAYHYANALAHRGHTVRVIHPPWCNIKESVSPANYLRQLVKMAAGPLAASRLKNSVVDWFALDESVVQVNVPDIREQHIPDADATIATAWTTAPWVADYSATKGKGYYLIQHYEAWDGHFSAVDKTWQLPLHKIVIAKWLLAKSQELDKHGEVTYIPNGIDLTQFRLLHPIAGRGPTVAMLGHKALWKGVADGIQALEIVRGILPEVKAVVFGTDPRPESLPDWFQYKQLPSAEELTNLYNAAAIFLHPSWSEGLPAPPVEAMACGCAVVAAENEGVMDYLDSGINALTAPTKQPDRLASCVLQLLQDQKLHDSVATAGYETAGKLDWARSDEAFEEMLIGPLS